MAYNPFSLEGKTILITGASSGIGKATAIECSKFGAKIVLTGRNEERLSQTFLKLSGEGHIMIAIDLDDEDAISSLVEQLPQIDGLSCNAGISVGTKPVAFYKKKDMEKIFLTNTMSTAILVKTLLKKKKFRNPASIVLTSSIEGNYETSIGNGLYGMSKAALSSYSRNVALELASKGIRCNVVAPGMVRTPLTAPTGELTQEQLDKDMARYPLGRYGNPEEIAWAIIYLLSDATCWMTGSTLKIDGGITLV